MRRLAVSLLVFLVLAGLARTASADATVFIGSARDPDSRLVKGFSVGMSLIIIGFEFEYASIAEDEANLAPSLRTWMGNLLIQTPDVGTFQLYATTGGGMYREALLDDSKTNFGVNMGGGAKIPLAGPLRLRLDYRFIKLQGSPLQSTNHRFYAGLNLKF